MFRTPFFATVIVLGSCLSSMAANISFVPPGLQPGDNYHVLFITRDATAAISDDSDDYNAFAQEQAELTGAVTANWGIEWSAIVGTADIPANENALVSAPVYLLSGDLAFTGYDDLWDLSTPRLPTQTDQFGAAPVRVFDAWTGSLVDGFSDSVAMGSSFPFYLRVTYPAGALYFGDSDIPASSELPIYALSEVLTVVPEPTGLNALIMLLGVPAIRRRRQQRQQRR